MDEAAMRPAGGDDHSLVRRALRGSQDAYADLVRRHQGRVAGIVGRFFRQRETVEDVAQDVFLKAFQALPSWRAEVPLEHWLARITVNTCYDRLRRLRRGREIAASQLAEDVPGFWDRLTAPEDSRDASFWQREDARLIAERALELLAPADRLVLTLMVMEELPAKEVAHLTGWSVANVKVRAFRARRRLRAVLDGSGPR